MPKPGLPLPAPAGLADWLPLLGSICQVLATLGEDGAGAKGDGAKVDGGRSRAEPDALPAQGRRQAETL